MCNVCNGCVIGVKGGKHASPRERDIFRSSPAASPSHTPPPPGEGPAWHWIHLRLSVCLSVSLKKSMNYGTFPDSETEIAKRLVHV